MKPALIPAAVIAAGLVLAPVAGASPPYSSCAQAAADGVTDIPQGSNAYNPDLDRDGDGVACESQ